MTKKNKRKGPTLEDLLARPWCYYCERDFDDLKILINHQRAKHYKCERCQKRLNTAGGLAVHMTQVHKETLETIDNAIPGRESVDIEIFGMEGIPEPELIQHRNRIMAQFQQDEQDRRVQAGLPGTSKKPKIEKLDPEEIKRRLAEHKKMLAEGQLKQQQQGHVPEGQSPIGGAQSPALNGVVQGSPPPQNFYSQPPTGPAAYQHAYSQPPQSLPAYPAPQGMPQFKNPQFPVPGQFNGSYGGFPNNGGFPPHPNMPQSPHQSPPPYNQSPYQPPQHQPPQGPQNVPGLPPRPPAPGLPQRPSFPAPPAPTQQPPFSQQPGFSQYGAPGAGASPAISGYGPPPGLPPMPQHQQNGFNGTASVSRSPLPAHPQLAPPHAAPHAAPGSSMATGSNVPLPPAPVSASPATEEAKQEKKEEKKDKKEVKLVWSDNEVSPEEKRARLPRYAFAPSTASHAPALAA